MADQTSTYAIQMVDDVSGAAETAASALAKLDQQMEADTKRLAGMQKALRNLQGATTPNIAAIKKMQEAIATQKSTIADTTAKQLALGGSFVKSAPKGPDPRVEQMKALQDQVNQMQGLAGKLEGLTEKYEALKTATAQYREQLKEQNTALTTAQSSLAKTETKLESLQEKHDALKGKTSELGERFKALSGQASQMPGPLGNLAAKLGQIRGMVAGGALAAGVLAIAAALLALVAGAAAATRALYKYGVAQADARRSELLRLEGLTKMRFLFQRMPGNAKEMQNAIDQVAAKTPIAREEVAKYNDQLYRMGLRGNALTKTLEAVAIKSAVQGDEAAQAFAGWAAGASLAGHGVDKLADSVKARLGGIAAKQMQSLTVQTLKQKEAQDALFSGLDIDAWLSAWKEVRDLMSQATATGRALKMMLTTILQPLIGASTSGAPIVKRFFQGMVIAALQLFIAVLKIRNWFKRTFGDTSLFGGIDYMKAAVYVGRAVLISLAVVLGVVAVAILNVLRPLILVGNALAWLYSKVETFIEFIEDNDWATIAVAIFDTIFDAIMQLPIFQLGKWIIDGIVKGLELGPIVDKMKGLASSGLQAFAKAIGAESPAKAFVRVGQTIPEGVAVGVEQGTPDAQAATAAMVDAAAPALGPSSGSQTGALGAAGAAAAARSGATINIATINVNGSGDAKQLAADFRRELERVLEGFVFEFGAREASA